MTGLVPLHRPQLPAAAVRATVERLVRADPHVAAEPLLRDCPVRVLAVRGYFRRTMGDPTKNDVGINDDAFFVITPTAIGRYNGNTDPSRLGLNKSIGKDFAVLEPGVYPYKPGDHRGEPGHLRQCDGRGDPARFALPTYFGDDRAEGQVAVRRGTVLHWGYFGINFHSASTRSTSSAGCQTFPPAQWPGFRDQVLGGLHDAKQLWVLYALTDEKLA